MTGNVAEGPGSGLLDRGVEFFKTGYEGFNRVGVDDFLGHGGGVAGDRAEDEGSGLLEEAVLFAEGVDELGEDVAVDDVLSELLRVVGEAAKGEGGGLLDGGDAVEEEGAEELHDAGVVEGFNVLRAGSEFGDSLDELDTSLLVFLKNLDDLTGHFFLIFDFIFS